MSAVIEAICKHYLTRFPVESKKLERLSGQLKRKKGGDILSRKDFDEGHVTVGAFIVEKGTNRVLLIEHKALNKLIQPGGHVELYDQDILDAVLREVIEETGLQQAQLQYLPAMISEEQVPIDIDVHRIPASARKNEPAHYHYDFRYAFTVEPDVKVRIDPEESISFCWVDWEAFVNDPEFVACAPKLKTLL